MLLHQRRFLPTALFACAAAFLLGLGNLLTATVAPQHPRVDDRPRNAARSGDDAGFSISLASPKSPYLLGRQTITIDTRIPPGDSIDQVDIFVDGRVVFTDRQPPYAYETDFGETIRRHEILATAVTHQGRRARVSFISRLGTLVDSAARPVEVVPATVITPEGRPARNLSVSDFILTDNGARQRIVHFDASPAPASIAVVVEAPRTVEAALPALLAGAAAFSEPLPDYQALSLVGSAESAGTDSGAAAPALEFSYARDIFRQRLDQAATGPRPTGLLGDRLAAAASGLKARADQRVLLLLLSEPPVPPEAGPVEGERKPAPSKKPRSASTPPSPEEALAAGLEALKRTGATLYVIMLVEPAGERDAGATKGDAAAADGDEVRGEQTAAEGAGMEASSIENVLKKSAEESGGSFLKVGTSAEVQQSGRAVADLVRQRYLIGYLTEAAQRPGSRTIDLKVRRPGLEVRARKYSIAE